MISSVFLRQDQSVLLGLSVYKNTKITGKMVFW